MGHKQSQKYCSPYVSCIKINGKPILPPVLTEQKLKEIRQYKLKALEIEKRISAKKTSKSVVESKEADLSNLYTTSLEHRLAFEESQSPLPSQPSCLPKTNSVPCDNQNSSLTCDIVDISEYSSEGVRLFDSSICDATFKDKDNHNLSSSCDESKELFSDLPKPRLIRSNSYTLESPSPMLLAHLHESFELENTTQMSIYSNNVNCDGDSNKNVEGIERKDIENNGEVHKRNQYDNETNEYGNETYEYEKTNEYDKTNDSDKSKEYDNTNECDFNKLNECEFNETNECNDRQIDNLEINEVENLGTDKHVSSVKSPNIKRDIKTELLTVLNNIPENYAEKILQLLQEKPLDFNETKEKPPQIDYSHRNLLLKGVNDLSFDTVNSYTSSQTIYCMINGSNETLNAITPMAHSELNEDLVRPKTTESVKFVSDHTARNILNCSKELFPEKDTWIENHLKQEKAASVIGAHVKGYLVRRLMSTDRVQGLIQTIKDALICAMELHKESTENINESDVELHRRLIQQVSAACYEFNDIFFSISIPEQMSIIATDRQRKKEKLKRPPSTRSSRVSSASSLSSSRRLSGRKLCKT